MQEAGSAGHFGKFDNHFVRPFETLCSLGWHQVLTFSSHAIRLYVYHFRI